MKILDERGRLFGVVNIIDLLIVALLIYSVPVFIYAYKAMTRKTVPSPSRSAPPADKIRKWARVTTRFLNLSSELIPFVSEGDVQKDRQGKVIGKLVKIKGKKCIEDNIFNDESIMTSQPLIGCALVAEFDLYCDDEKQDLIYEGRLVKMGTIVTFVTDRYMITGDIIEFDPNRRIDGNAQ